MPDVDEPTTAHPGVETPEATSSSTELTIAAEVLPDTLILLPLHERPFFPPQTVPLLLSEETWLETVEQVGTEPGHLAGLVLVEMDSNPEQARPDDFAKVGTVVRMHRPGRNQGKIQFIAEGLQRFRIVQWISREPPYQARVASAGRPGPACCHPCRRR